MGQFWLQEDYQVLYNCISVMLWRTSKCNFYFLKSKVG